MARSRVELFEKIRKAHDREELSVRELSKRFGTHRRTVRQALASAMPPERKASPPRSSPVLDPWKATIDGWIEADKQAPKKQRHTARRIYQRLREEYDADVGESTVRRYVAQRKQSVGVPLREVTVPQHHPLGAGGEVDFGDVSFYLRGVLVVGKMFVMRLSASGKGFHRVYLHECQEAFLDGHVRAAEAFGGLPALVRYDNLTSAVTKVLKGRNRTENERFVALRSHYGFDSFFCMPGQDGAHEKGGVEGEVGRFRRRHLVPMPHVDSLAELNELCAKGDLADDKRHIFGRSMTVGEHFALEQAELAPLPEEAFDVRLRSENRVDPKSRVCVRQCRYSVPVRLAGRRVTVLLGAETVDLYDGSKLVASHERAVGKGRDVLLLDHYLEVFKIKPGALPGSTALHQARTAGHFTGHHDDFYAEARRRLGDAAGTKAMVEVLLLHRSLPHHGVTAGIDAALRVGSIDAAVVAIEARRHLAKAANPVVAIEGAMRRYDRPAPSLDGYDQLLKGNER
jgi:transposase